jgi:hypothetical protein
VSGSFLHIFELHSIFERCGAEGSTNRVRRVAAVEPELAGVFPDGAIDRIRVHAPAFLLALAILLQRPVYVERVAGRRSKQAAVCGLIASASQQAAVA